MCVCVCVRLFRCLSAKMNFILIYAQTSADFGRQTKAQVVVRGLWPASSNNNTIFTHADSLTRTHTHIHTSSHATAWKRKRKYAQFFNKTMSVSRAKGDNNNSKNNRRWGNCKMINRKVFLAFSLNFSCTCTKLFKFLAVCLSFLFSVFSFRLCFKCVSHFKYEFFLSA